MYITTFQWNLILSFKSKSQIDIWKVLGFQIPDSIQALLLIFDNFWI